MTLQAAIDNAYDVVRPWLDDRKFNDRARIAAFDAALAKIASAAGARPSLAIASTDIGRLIDEVIEREGGYVNHPHDKGGPTNWGITQAVARTNGFSGDMRLLPRAKAVEIYRKLYWTAPRFDAVAAIYPRVAAELFDTGINMGPGTAVRFLQRAMNAIAGSIAIDGKVGPATLAAVEVFKRQRGAAGENVLVAVLDCLQGERYVALVEDRAQNRSFIYGWLTHRIGQA